MFQGKPYVSVGPVESMLSTLYGVLIGAKSSLLNR